MNYKFTKAELLDILDRIIKFIHSCDTKASIILGIIGVSLIVFFTGGGIDNIKFIIINTYLLLPSCINIVCFIFLLLKIILSFILIVSGIIYILLVLYPKTDKSLFQQEGLDSGSIIFFGTIAEKDFNKCRKYLQYKDKLLNTTAENYENDIISQIYINGGICHKKHENFKRGCKLTFIGAILTILLLILGNLVIWIMQSSGN